MAESAAEPDGGSQTLERGLWVLTELARHPAGLTTAELVVACGLHRSIVYRLLVSLVRTGFAERRPDGRYTAGAAAAELSRRARPRLRDVVVPILHELAREADATASLVEVDGDVAVTTVVAEPPTDGPRFSYRLGSRDPLDRGSGGLAALASLPAVPGEPERVAAVRVAGYAKTYGELNPGAFGIAVPLPHWGVPAAVNVVTNRPELADSLVEPLRRAAARIDAIRSRTDRHDGGAASPAAAVADS